MELGAIFLFSIKYSKLGHCPNLLFFDRSRQTESVWYYEIQGPHDRQTYSKTKPFKFEELADCISWWGERCENSRAWLVNRDEIVARGYDMDIQNPAAIPDLNSRHPTELIRAIEETSNEAAIIAAKLQAIFSPDTLSSVVSGKIHRLSDFIKLRKEFISISNTEMHKLLTVQLHARGIRLRGEKLGIEIKTKKQQVVRAGELVVAEIDAKLGGFGIVPPESAGSIVSSHYFVYEIDQTIIMPRFFEWWLRSGIPEQLIQPHVKGSTNYAAIRQQHFPLLEMRVPSLDQQRIIVAYLDELQAKVDVLRCLQAETGAELDALMPAVLDRAFKGEM